MPTFEERIFGYCDTRVSTLGRIKARSLGADVLTLTALKVLVYAQLEGGIKDLASCVFRGINSRRMALGEINPRLLQWRNADDIYRFRSMVTFDMIGTPTPFAAELGRYLKIRGINRKREFNQMDWESVRRVYSGLGLDCRSVEKLREQITHIVEDRNNAAHHGVLPTVATTLMERQVRESADAVEHVLTDFSLQLLPFFKDNLHRR
jgi:hypothetical protein